VFDAQAITSFHSLMYAVCADLLIFSESVRIGGGFILQQSHVAFDASFESIHIHFQRSFNYICGSF